MQPPGWRSSLQGKVPVGCLPLARPRGLRASLGPGAFAVAVAVAAGPPASGLAGCPAGPTPPPIASFLLFIFPADGPSPPIYRMAPGDSQAARLHLAAGPPCQHQVGNRIHLPLPGRGARSRGFLPPAPSCLPGRICRHETPIVKPTRLRGC